MVNENRNIYDWTITIVDFPIHESLNVRKMRRLMGKQFLANQEPVSSRQEHHESVHAIGNMLL